MIARQVGGQWVGIGALLAGLGVMLGAFGAHALKARLPGDLMAIFETGNRYHMYHALGLMAVGLMAHQAPRRAFAVAGWGLFVGILIFSGSLYALALTGIGVLGAITPLGGLAFIVGWFALAYGCLSKQEKSHSGESPHGQPSSS